MSAHAVKPVRDALYEQPGPKTRKAIIAGTVVASILVIIFLGLIVRQFYITGQLSPKYWSFFAEAHTWLFLAEGFFGTIKSAVVAGILALAAGIVLMLGRFSNVLPVRFLARAVTEFFRGVPSLLFVYFFFLVLPQMGIKIPSLGPIPAAYWMIMLPAAISAAGACAEVFRAGVHAVPKGQVEAASSLGMGKWKTMFLIQLPQAIKFVVPTLVAQLVIVVKDTTLAYVVSYPDLLQNGRVLIANYDALVSVYFIIAIIYIILNYLINKASVAVANRSGVKLIRPQEVDPV